jgi:hypothetical protein
VGRAAVRADLLRQLQSRHRPAAPGLEFDADFKDMFEVRGAHRPDAV